jgi:hypothetical protein
VNEHSPAANDEVSLVLCVRRLLARAQREGKGYVKRATPQDHHFGYVFTVNGKSFTGWEGPGKDGLEIGRPVLA